LQALDFNFHQSHQPLRLEVSIEADGVVYNRIVLKLSAVAERSDSVGEVIKEFHLARIIKEIPWLLEFSSSQRLKLKYHA